VKNLVIQRLTDFQCENIKATEKKGLINNSDGKNVLRETVRWTDTIKMGLKNIKILRFTGL